MASPDMAWQGKAGRSAAQPPSSRPTFLPTSFPLSLPGLPGCQGYFFWVTQEACGARARARQAAPQRPLFKNRIAAVGTFIWHPGGPRARRIKFQSDGEYQRTSAFLPGSQSQSIGVAFSCFRPGRLSTSTDGLWSKVRHGVDYIITVVVVVSLAGLSAMASREDCPFSPWLIRHHRIF